MKLFQKKFFDDSVLVLDQGPNWIVIQKDGEIIGCSDPEIPVKKTMFTFKQIKKFYKKPLTRLSNRSLNKKQYETLQKAWNLKNIGYCYLCDRWQFPVKRDDGGFNYICGSCWGDLDSKLWKDED